MGNRIEVRKVSRSRRSPAIAVLVAFVASGLGGVGAGEPVDLAVVHRIKDEALHHSRVMDPMFHLADENGPRLTNSPGYRAAAGWAVETLKGWGIDTARLESWGRFGRGWSVTHFSAQMVEPVYAPLESVPKAWTRGTDGPVSAEVVIAHLYDSVQEEREISWDLAKLEAHYHAWENEHRGKLRGKIVLISPPRELSLPTKPEGVRYDAKALGNLADAPSPLPPGPPVEYPITKLPDDREKRRALLGSVPAPAIEDFWRRREKLRDILNAFLRDEGVVAVLETGGRGDGGIVFSEAQGSRQPDRPVPPPALVLAPEPYSRLHRLADHGVPVKVEIDLRVEVQDDDLDGYNVVAEIPGGRKPDEVVMLGAHLDSWHGGTGATDNAAGCAVALEAVRILKALDLPLDRTVRLALWGGEEQGLLGSRGYVRRHFGDPATMELKPEHARLSGYFNLDNGAGRIRGVYLQGNDMMRPVFNAWFRPFSDMGVDTVSIRNTGGTDHLSFDAVGLPAFQFIQDPLDYFTRTHHSNLDVVDHVEAGDLMQASAVMATVIYEAANREEMLPRKPLPEPLPPGALDAESTSKR